MKDTYQNIIKKLSRDLAWEIDENEHLNDAYLLTLDDEVFQIGMSFANGLLDALFKKRSEKIRLKYRKHAYHVCKNKEEEAFSRNESSIGYRKNAAKRMGQKLHR